MKLRAGIAFALMVCMVLASLGIGAYRGWSQERALVEETYAGLESMIRTRVETAYNLLTVASRHLPEKDEDMARVAADRDVLESGAKLSEKAAAHAALTQDAAALLNKLAPLESVQNDARDLMYVTGYLPQMLSESEERAEGAVYNTAAAQFNRDFRQSFSGFLARMLGVSAAEEFIAP